MREFWERLLRARPLLYNELIHVPLFVKLPGRAKAVPRRAGLHRQPVPTLLDLIGAPAPPDSSYAPCGRRWTDQGWTPPGRQLHASTRSANGRVRVSSTSGRRDREEAIFDLVADPGSGTTWRRPPERLRLARAAFAEQERLCPALRDHFGIHGSVTTELKPEALEQLRRSATSSSAAAQRDAEALFRAAPRGGHRRGPQLLLHVVAH
jgi:hypothetical protein